jgi:hypothetical protein
MHQNIQNAFPSRTIMILLEGLKRLKRLTQGQLTQSHMHKCEAHCLWLEMEGLSFLRLSEDSKDTALFIAKFTEAIAKSTNK